MTNAGQLLAEKSAYVNNGVQYVLKKKFEEAGQAEDTRSCSRSKQIFGSLGILLLAGCYKNT